MQQNLTEKISKKITFANCILDPNYQTLSTPIKIIRLRNKLFFVLRYLVSNESQLVTREQLIKDCWLGNQYTGQKAVTHSICHLRKLIEDLQIPVSITTLSKQGYIFKVMSHARKKTIPQNQDCSNQNFAI